MRNGLKYSNIVKKRFGAVAVRLWFFSIYLHVCSVLYYGLMNRNVGKGEIRTKDQ